MVCASRLFLSLVSLILAACASAAPQPVEWRLMVKLSQPSTDTAAIERGVSRGASVPAHYQASISPQWHSVSLACDTDTRCARAVQRLRADKTFIEAVERDERKQAQRP